MFRNSNPDHVTGAHYGRSQGPALDRAGCLVPRPGLCRPCPVLRRRKLSHMAWKGMMDFWRGIAPDARFGASRVLPSSMGRAVRYTTFHTGPYRSPNTRGIAPWFGCLFRHVPSGCNDTRGAHSFYGRNTVPYHGNTHLCLWRTVPQRLPWRDAGAAGRHGQVRAQQTTGNVPGRVPPDRHGGHVARSHQYVVYRPAERDRTALAETGRIWHHAPDTT